MQDWKTTDKSARLENAGLENDGHHCRGWKMQDWKLTPKLAVDRVHPWVGLGGLFSNFVWVGLGSDLRRNCCNLISISIGLLSLTFDLYWSTSFHSSFLVNCQFRFVLYVISDCCKMNIGHFGSKSYNKCISVVIIQPPLMLFS